MLDIILDTVVIQKAVMLSLQTYSWEQIAQDRVDLYKSPTYFKVYSYFYSVLNKNKKKYVYPVNPSFATYMKVGFKGVYFSWMCCSHVVTISDIHIYLCLCDNEKKHV